jgi:hypothetical protein
MPVTPGKKYFFITHAYYHFVAKVVQITGKREADIENVVRVQPTNRDWEDFFKNGFREPNEYKKFPDGGITWIDYFEWNHPIPGEK